MRRQRGAKDVVRSKFFSKKAQLTLLVIVGLMLVLVFFIMFSLRKTVLPGKEAVSLNKVIYELESGLVKDHITSCAFKTASDGLERLGANGGYVYSFDGGQVPVSGVDEAGGVKEGVDFVNYTRGARTFLVAYGLRENSFCPKIDYSTPGYPISPTFISDLPQTYSSTESCSYNHSASDYDGFYGQVTLPKLCQMLGGSGCELFAKGTVIGLTFEKQLEDFVERKVPLCIDLSQFEDVLGAKLSQDGNISVKVSIRDSDVQVAVSYPFKVIFKDEAPISKVVDYQSVLKVRLGRIYNFVYSVLSFEARDLFYDLKVKAAASPFYTAGFEFKKLENFCTSCPLPLKYDDLLEVIDTKSLLNGKPFLFRTVIQDRRPLLEFIENRSYDLSSSLPPELQVSEAAIPLLAKDPDDTPLKYYFLSEGHGDGWREPLGVDSPDDQFFFVEDNVTLRLLPLYSRSDLGNHTVGVMVVDETGFFDYQWFKIIISDSDYAAPYNPTCFDDCNAAGAGENCDYLCWISANPCQSVCKSDYYGRYDPASLEYEQCTFCLFRIYYSDMQESHVSCPSISSEQDCISKMPDCFWVWEKASDPVHFEGSCYDDRRLNEVSRPALISR